MPALDHQQVHIDKPHDPWGEHVDIRTPCGNGVYHKDRIGPDGNSISHDWEAPQGGPRDY